MFVLKWKKKFWKKPAVLGCNRIFGTMRCRWNAVWNIWVTRHVVEFGGIPCHPPLCHGIPRNSNISFFVSQNWDRIFESLKIGFYKMRYKFWIPKKRSDLHQCRFLGNIYLGFVTFTHHLWHPRSVPIFFILIFDIFF